VSIFRADQVHKKLADQWLHLPWPQSQSLVRKAVIVLWAQCCMISNVFHGNNVPVSCVGGCFSQEKRFRRIVTHGKFYEWYSVFKEEFTVVRIFQVILCKLLLVKGPPLWSSGQSSWLQSQRSRVRFPALSDFWKVVGLEQGPLSLVSIIEELLVGKSSGSGLENREYGCWDPLCWLRNTFYSYTQRLALTLSTSSGRSVDIVGSRTKGHLLLVKHYIWLIWVRSLAW
jgi:hypothetical protein